MAYQQRTEENPRTFRLRTDIGEWLDETAAALGMSKNQLLNDAVAEKAGLPLCEHEGAEKEE